LIRNAYSGSYRKFGTAGLVVGKQELFDDTETEKGKVYKYRSSEYIKSGAHYSFSSVQFDADIYLQEWQLYVLKKDFEEQLKYTPARKEWTQILEDENSSFFHTFANRLPSMRELFDNQCCLYFPVNRFEDPAWLNIENLKSKVSYTELKKIAGYSNRNILCASPLKNNMNWILDIIFDRQAFEIVRNKIPVTILGDNAPVVLDHFSGYQGQSSNIYDAVHQVLGVILGSNRNLRLGAGNRKNRRIAVMRDEETWIPNLFQLSTGETQLLNLFLSIVRDYDLSGGEFRTLGDIKGIVVIDEIDAHLHTVHQKEVLPELIASFPNVQFVITTHSPLLLVGMEERFGSDGFIIYNMPSGNRVTAGDFSEFIAAYNAFKETTKHREEIQKELAENSRPILFVEGDYDIRYIKKAAEVLGKKCALDRIQVKDGGGYGNLDKIWKSYDNAMSDAISGRILLLYDCDTNKKDTIRNRVYKRVIPSVPKNPIEIGIENLFPDSTIQKIELENPQFIDVQEQISKRVRGEIKTTSAQKSVNGDEKGNMCDWLCVNGSAEDFSGFEVVFDIIEKFLSN